MGNEKRRIIDPKMTVMGNIIQKRINMEKEYERFLGCLCPEDKKYYKETKNKAIKMEFRYRSSLVYLVLFPFVPAMISLALDFFGEYLPKDTSLFIPIFSTRTSVALLLLSFFFLPLTLYLRGKFKKFTEEEVKGRRFRLLVEKSKSFYEKAKSEARETAIRNSSITLK